MNYETAMQHANEITTEIRTLRDQHLAATASANSKLARIATALETIALCVASLGAGEAHAIRTIHPRR
jgi:hypothetical protein